jgi:hypothetical protein
MLRMGVAERASLAEVAVSFSVAASIESGLPKCAKGLFAVTQIAEGTYARTGKRGVSCGEPIIGPRSSGRRHVG